MERKFRQNGDPSASGKYDQQFSQSSKFGDNDSFMEFDAGIKGQILLGAQMKQMCDRIPDRDVLNPQLLKKYISYSRHTVFPKLSMEACEVLKAFYITLRENATNNANTLPITSRALDSLIRLS